MSISNLLVGIERWKPHCFGGVTHHVTLSSSTYHTTWKYLLF